MKQLINYINAVKSHLNSEFDLGEALTKAMPIISKMKDKDRTVRFHTNIAPLIAQAYKAEAVLTRNGTTSFNDKKTGKRADTALSKFRYVTQIKLQTKKPVAKVSKQIDVVEKLLASVYALPKAEQARFIKLILSDRK